MKDIKSPAILKLTKLAAKYKYVVLMIAAGLVLIALPGAKSSAETDQAPPTVEVEALEKKIESALSSCDGVGRVRAVLSVKSGPESIYAKDERTSNRGDESSESDIKPSIISKGSGSESPVLIKEIYPSFRGALIICDGASDISVREKVSESVSALTGLSSDKISIVKMKK